MPSVINRLYNRLRSEKEHALRNIHDRRKRALLSHQPQQQDEATDQSQAAFFTKFPLEIRQMIYKEVLRTETNVIHILKPPRKSLEFVRCHSICSMDFNYKCMGRKTERGCQVYEEIYPWQKQEPIPMLQTCQKMYTEAIEILYGYYLLDFRCFDACICFWQSLPTQRQKAIRKVHLQWHFGFNLTLKDWEPLRLSSPPTWGQVWNQTWKTLSEMSEIRELYLDIFAYVTKNEAPGSVVEAAILEPVMEVSSASKIVVKLSWPPSIDPSSLGPRLMLEWAPYYGRNTLRKEMRRKYESGNGSPLQARLSIPN
ncbi:hypothetical protein ACLMJK_005484 [Lecanora helva]